MVLFPRCKLLVAIVLWLVLATCGRAGIYNSAEHFPVGGDYPEFRATMTKVRRMIVPYVVMYEKKVPIETPERKHALMALTLFDHFKNLPARPKKSSNPFGKRVPTAKLSPDDYLNISAYLIRLNRHDDAIALLKKVLKPILRGASRQADAKQKMARFKLEYPNYFLLCANYATAYHIKSIGDPSFRLRAFDNFDLVRDNWPAQFSTLPKEHQIYFRKFGWDQDQLRWFKLVEKYQRKLLLGKTGIPEIATTVFGDPKGKPIRFVGKSGEYTAGELDLKEKKKMPPNALKIVQQLSVWFPENKGVYWLVAELYNARGKKQDIEGAYRILSELSNDPANPDKKLVKSRARVLKKHLDNPIVPKDSGWSPVQLLGVGFLGGALIVLLGVWQVSMLRRRRRR